MTKIQSMDCKFCNRPVTLLSIIGTAKGYGFYGPTAILNIVEATCKHLALTDPKEGRVLTQHCDLANVKENHHVELYNPPKVWEFNGEAVIEPNKVEKI